MAHAMLRMRELPARRPPLRRVGMIVGVDSLSGPRDQRHYPFWRWPTELAQVPLEDFVGDKRDRTRVAYVNTAQRLDAQGISIIVSDNSASFLVQEDVTAKVSRPAVLSVLSLVPWIAQQVPPGQQIGVISTATDFFRSVIASSPMLQKHERQLSVFGLEGTFLNRPIDPDLNPAAVFALDRKEVTDVIVPRLRACKSLGAVVLSETQLIPHAHVLREMLGLAVFDLKSLIACYMGQESPPSD